MPIPHKPKTWKDNVITIVSIPITVYTGLVVFFAPWFIGSVVKEPTETGRIIEHIVIPILKYTAFQKHEFIGDINECNRSDKKEIIQNLRVMFGKKGMLRDLEEKWYGRELVLISHDWNIGTAHDIRASRATWYLWRTGIHKLTLRNPVTGEEYEYNLSG